MPLSASLAISTVLYLIMNIAEVFPFTGMDTVALSVTKRSIKISCPISSFGFW